MRYQEVQSEISNPAYPLLVNQDDNYFYVLNLAYFVYHKVKLVKDQHQFSVRVLGKAPSYLSCMKARNRTPSRHVMERLLKDAKYQTSSIASNNHFGAEYSIQLNNTHKQLQALVHAIEQTLFVDEECSSVVES
ncbi:DUF6626 family protein [Lentilitoribacter sp. Alg239-R112]|uniref:DUF6626 family protein n=1 Tax=Lentilitoribacter sp. Alg239-R112 TaxID=2305987 RepID=UPI0013A70B63|nr:DUF6626 family protein [Lentilitoribacter sp. Alg239-R112]